MMEFTGNISISRTTSNKDPDYIHIRLIDEASGMVVTDIEMSVEAFGYAVTGMSMQECNFELIDVRHADKVGKTREIKSEPVYLEGDNPMHDHERIIAKAKALEVDGWICNLNKQQRITVESAGELWKVTVPFVRWTDTAEQS